MFNPQRVGQDLDEARRNHGGRHWPNSFADRLTSPLPGLADLARTLRPGGPRAADLSEASRIPVRAQPQLGPVPAGRAAASWIGHATFAIQLGGLTILTDPVWSTRIPGVRTRLTPPGIPLAGIGDVDAVLISHNHYDHLDAPTIRRLPRQTPMLVPGMLGAWFRRRGFQQVIELDWWDSVRIGDVAFDFLPAHHWSQRSLSDASRTLWGGWALSTADTKIYFAGDSGYGHWFGEIAQRHPGIDLALLPVGGYQSDWFVKPLQMNPVEAVQACADLGARRMAPMHWGTFVLSAEPPLDPVRRTVEAWAQAGRSRGDLWDLAIGETRMMEPRATPPDDASAPTTPTPATPAPATPTPATPTPATSATPTMPAPRTAPAARTEPPDETAAPTGHDRWAD